MGADHLQLEAVGEAEVRVLQRNARSNASLINQRYGAGAAGPIALVLVSTRDPAIMTDHGTGYAPIRERRRSRCLTVRKPL